MSKIICTHRKRVLIDAKFPEELPPETRQRYKYQSRYRVYAWVDCGKCHACMLKKRNQWVVRLATQFKDTPRAFWSLFTYNNEHVPAFNELGKKRFSAFMKRFRRYLAYHWKWKGVKFFCAGEYGDKFNRPHFHSIIYNLPPCPRGKKGVCPALKYRLEMYWKQGFVKTKILESVSQIYYCSKYAVKGFANHDNSKPCILFSKGLGLNYIKKNLAHIREKALDVLKPVSPILHVGKFTIFLDRCKTYRKYIYGVLGNFYKFIDYVHTVCNPLTGHPFEYDEKYNFSVYAENSVKTNNSTWRQLNVC